MADEHVRVAEDLSRDLDLIVFELERAPPAEVAALHAERAVLRKKLDRLRERLDDLAHKLG